MNKLITRFLFLALFSSPTCVKSTKDTIDGGTEEAHAGQLPCAVNDDLTPQKTLEERQDERWATWLPQWRASLFQPIKPDVAPGERPEVIPVLPASRAAMQKAIRDHIDTQIAQSLRTTKRKKHLRRNQRRPASQRLLDANRPIPRKTSEGRSYEDTGHTPARPLRALNHNLPGPRGTQTTKRPRPTRRKESLSTAWFPQEHRRSTALLTGRVLADRDIARHPQATCLSLGTRPSQEKHSH